MALWWVTLFSLILTLGFIGCIMIYGLKGALRSEDSTTIDSVPKEKD